jgi:hypothetical protein
MKNVKTPILTILKAGDVTMDFVPLGVELMRSKVKRERLQMLKIRVHTILSNLVQSADKKSFPQPLLIFMNTFMSDGGLLPYEFLSEFELDVISFDKYDAITNYTPKHKFLQIGSFIFPQYLISKVLLNPEASGIKMEITQRAETNLFLLASLLHGLYSDVMYDIFKSQMIDDLQVLDP